MLLEVSDLETGYGRTGVLHGINLAMAEDQRIGLFGPNGHGKTTLLMAISGLLPTWKGSIRFMGDDISNIAPRRIVDLGIVHVPQGNKLFPDMTVDENLSLGAYCKRSRPKARANLERVYDIFPKLKQRGTQLCKTLSGGERQMVSIGIGVMSDPKLLLLDEPTLGLAPKLKDELCDAIDRISQSGLPLIVVEQDVEFLLTLAQDLYMINHGEVVQRLSADDDIDHGEIMKMYFGEA